MKKYSMAYKNEEGVLVSHRGRKTTKPLKKKKEASLVWKKVRYISPSPFFHSYDWVVLEDYWDTVKVRLTSNHISNRGEESVEIINKNKIQISN